MARLKAIAYVVFLGVLVFVFHAVRPRPLNPHAADAITLGQAYAYALLTENPYHIIGLDNVEDLFQISSGLASETLATKTFHPVPLSDASELFSDLSEQNIPEDLLRPLMSEFGQIKLLSVDMKDTRAHMVFTYAEASDVPGKGPVNATIDAYYVIARGGRSTHTLWDNFQRLPIIEYVTGKYRIEGYWIVTSFDYGATLTDYYNWLKTK